MAVACRTSRHEYFFESSSKNASARRTQAASVSLSPLRSGLWSLWWPVSDLDAERLGVLGVQALPTELHGLASDDAPDVLARHELIADLEPNSLAAPPPHPA